MGFSISDLNPLNYVDDAVEWASDAIGLPEGVGDILSIGAAYLTGDIEGMIDGGLDLSENVFAGIKGFVEGFLSDPSRAESECKCGGYAKGKAESSEDIGVFQRMGRFIDRFGGGISGMLGLGEALGKAADEAIAKAGKKEGSSGAEQTGQSEWDSVINDPNASIEDKIFALLMKLQEKQQNKIKEKAEKIDSKTSSGNETQSAASSKDATELQKMTQDLQQLQSITTNILQLFHDAKKNALQNIGR